jgi:hypothetical protein
LQGYKPDNTTYAGPEGTMSGNNLCHDQKVGSGLTSP